MLRSACLSSRPSACFGCSSHHKENRSPSILRRRGVRCSRAPVPTSPATLLTEPRKESRPSLPAGAATWTSIGATRGMMPTPKTPRVVRLHTPLLAGVIFEKYILVFQIQIFGFKYKIQEGLKPDRNNAREGRIVGRDAEGARRGLCAACPPRPRGATAAWRPDRLQWQIVQVVPSRPTSVRTQWHTGPGA